MTEEKQKQKDQGTTVKKKIGNTTYEVVVHFSETSKETMEDKIKRMMKNDVLNGKYRKSEVTTKCILIRINTF